jgi:hypothetical protein
MEGESHVMPELGDQELDQSGIPVKWPTTPQDWNEQRCLVKRLYLDENRTLKEVMSIMERNHGFKAT